MKPYLTFVPVALLAAFLQTLSAAEISGKVTLKGTPPPETTIALNPDCGKLHSKPLTTRFYVVSPDGGLANVFVYIKNPPAGKKYEPPAQEAVLDQLNCEYQPYVMAVMVNQKVKIRNSDPFLHNINSSASIHPSHRFNIAQTSKGQENVKTFDKPELPVKMMCNVHNWMFAYISVFDHPYFAVTDKDGKFSFPADLPAGKYTVVAKHMKAGEATQEVIVGEGEKKTVEFTLEPPQPK